MRSGVDGAALIHAARAGDKDALNRLLAAYRHYLRILAAAGIGNALQAKADASDLAQETLLDASQHFGDFRGETSREFAAWLRKILARNLAELGRRYLGTGARRVQRERSLEQMLEDSSIALARLGQKREESPIDRAIRDERAAFLADLLSNLKEDHRRVIVLRDLEQLPWEAVGTRMGRSAEAARLLWVRALQALGPHLEGRQL